MHRDWFVDGANVFVEIYTDRVEVVSPGGLPKGMTLDDLGRKSIRRNALIADLLHRIDFIEKAGTGIRRIRDDVREQGCPEPKFETNGFFTAIFRPNPDVRAQIAEHAAGQMPGQIRGQVEAHDVAQLAGTGGTTLAPSQHQVGGEVTPEVKKMLSVMVGEMTRGEIQKKLELRDEKHFRENYQQIAIKLGLIEMTIPDKPRSSKQRYRLTRLGKRVLEQNSNK